MQNNGRAFGKMDNINNKMLDMKVLDMEELAALLETVEITIKLDLGTFCVELLEFICPENQQKRKAYLINDVSGKNLLIYVQE